MNSYMRKVIPVLNVALNYQEQVMFDIENSYIYNFKFTKILYMIAFELKLHVLVG